MSFAGENEPMLHLRAASDAACVATRDDAGVPPGRVATVPAPLDTAAALPVPLGRVRGGGSRANISGEWPLAVAQCHRKHRGSGQEPRAKTKQRKEVGLPLIRPPPLGAQRGGSHVNSPATVLHKRSSVFTLLPPTPGMSQRMPVYKRRCAGWL